MSHSKIGYFSTFKHPESAVQLQLSDHTKIIWCNYGRFICPICGAVSPVPFHGDAYQCNTCGVKYQAFGNSLYIWGHPTVYLKALSELTHKYEDNARARIKNRSERLELEQQKEKLLAEAKKLQETALQALIGVSHVSGTMDGADILIARAKGKGKYPKVEMPVGMQAILDHINEWANSNDPRDLMLVGIKNTPITIHKDV
jgi:hypothetical protein